MWKDARVIDAFRAAFQELIDASLLGDPQRFGPAIGRVYGLASQVPSSEREIALEALGPIFAGHHAGPGAEADLTVVAGALVEMGTAPGATGIEVLRLLREAGKSAGVFLHAWDKTGGGAPPEPERVTAAVEDRVAEVLGDSAPVATMCWWTARRYGLASKTMLSTASVRAAVHQDQTLHSDLLAVAGQLSAHLPEFAEVSALLRMDEVSGALVLERASRRGFRVRFSGIGDNFQLHTLLADALIGDQGYGVEGERPDPRWVAAFADADPDPQARVVNGWWNLVGADGTWVWNEGVPADIPLLEGERILVLEEQTYPRSWNAGRLYPLVKASLRVIGELAPEDAAHWWSLIQPEEQVEGFSTEAASAEPQAQAWPGAVAAPVFTPEPLPPPGSGSAHFGGGEPAPADPAGSWWSTEPAPTPFEPAPVQPPARPQPPTPPDAWSPPEPARPQSAEPAFDPAPEPPVAPELRPPPVATAATEIFTAITDADLAAYDERARATAPTAEEPAARAERFGGHDDQDETGPDEDDQAPGSKLLPPLPPGVSDSSGWGPSWL